MSDLDLTRLGPIVIQRVGAFFAWWGNELAAVVKSCLPARLGFDRDIVWITLKENSAVVFNGREQDHAVEIDFDPVHPEHQASQVREIVGSSETNGRVGLILSPDSVLRPTIKLPIAAAENLREVIGFEMDRHTPFREAEVFYDFRVRNTDRQASQLIVEVAASPRETIDRRLAITTAWGLAVESIAVADDDVGDGTPFNLLSGTASMRPRSSLRRLIAAEIALICALAAVAVLLPIMQKRDALATARAELAIIREEAAAVGDLRDQILALSGTIKFLIDEKKTRPLAVAVLNEITRILPDGTWLSDLNWEGSDLYIAGFSDQPSSLIGALEASPIFSEARFHAPVTAAPELEKQRFDIALVVTPGEERQ